MAKPVNPYIAGNPIRNKGFFGRTDILDWVAQELRNPGTSVIVLFGQRRIGKTTLLLQLQKSLPEDEFLPIFFDLQDQARRPLSLVLTDLAETMSDSLKVIEPLAEQLDDRGRIFRKEFLPTFMDKLKENIRPILLLDEFDILDDRTNEFTDEVAANNLFPFLRQIISEFPRIAFIFVAGRSPEDLSFNFYPTFKASLVKEIWVLDVDGAKRLIRQAEINGTLKFTDVAVERILALTNYHPFLTQLLCQRIWELAYADNPVSIPIIGIDEVNRAIGNTLSTGKSALQWIWDGLSIPERIYAAALAESAEENVPISDDKIIQMLLPYASRLRTHEVESAPRDLVKCRILEQTSSHHYVFSIELLRRWIRENRSLKVVKDELDREDNLEDKLFRVGEDYFKKKNWDKARETFETAFFENPRHLRTLLYLGETLLEMGKTKEAVDTFQKAFEISSVEARLPLVRAWVAYATTLRNNGDEDGALEACAQALELSPKERDAQNIRIAIWNKRGNKAMANNDWVIAYDAFQTAGDEVKANIIRERHQQEKDLERYFLEGVNALKRGDWARAKAAFKWIIDIRPEYEHDGQKAALLFAQAVEKKRWTWVTRRFMDRVILIILFLLCIVSFGLGMLLQNLIHFVP